VALSLALGIAFRPKKRDWRLYFGHASSQKRSASMATMPTFSCALSGPRVQNVGIEVPCADILSGAPRGFRPSDQGATE